MLFPITPLSWRQLCEAAYLSLIPKITGTNCRGSYRVLNRLEGGFQNLSEGEQLALQDALDMLHVLGDIAKREIVEQKTGT